MITHTLSRERDNRTTSCCQSEIGFIAVNYNSAQVTALLLADLLQQSGSNYTLTVVVADNSPSRSDSISLREAYRDHPNVRFELLPSNPGYFGAAQMAVHAVWKDKLPDWVIVSNVDIRLPKPNLLSRIADLPAGVGVIAPRIVSARTGLDQNPFHRRRPSAFRIYLNRIIPRVRFLFWLLETQCYVKRAVRSWLIHHRLRGGLRKPAAQSAPVYAPHGAFIIFSKEYFERGGTLNAGAFLFAEELFVAETCRRLRVNVTYMPSLEVLHDEHVSTQGNAAIRQFLAAAADYCYREFFSRSTA